MSHTTPVLLEPATRERAGLRIMLVLCSLLFGISVTEGVSNNLLPLTLRRFTEDPRLIGLILAINPAFGFIAQPLVGLLSDRIWTPIGRRAFFLITAAPVVAISLVLIPVCPALWQIVVFVVIYQFFEDILYGSDHPLVADLVPPEQRTFVMGLMVVSGQLATLFVLRAGMKMVEAHGEQALYYTAAACQILFVSGAAFFLKEKPVIREARPPLSVKRYLHDIRSSPTLFRLAIALFLSAVQANAISGFIALYATKTLMMAKSGFGDAWSATAFIPLIFAIPLGWIVERFPKQMVLIVSGALILCGCAAGYATSSLTGLRVAAIFLGFGGVMQGLTFKAFMTEYIPRDIIGQISGAINIFYAVGRTLALVLVPWFVFNEDYRVIWIFSGAVCVVYIAIMFTIRDLRYEERRRARRA